MNHLKTSYTHAITWRNNTGNGVAEEQGQETVDDVIRGICPHFDLLDQLFGHRANVNPPHILDTEDQFINEEHLIDEYIAEVLDRPEHNNDRLLTEIEQEAGPSTSQMSFNDEGKKNISNKFILFIVHLKCVLLQKICSIELHPCLSNNFHINCHFKMHLCCILHMILTLHFFIIIIVAEVIEEPRSKRRKVSTAGGAAGALMEMQERRMEVEGKRLEIEKDKWGKEIEIKEKEVLIKEKELELKLKEIEERKEIRMIELEHEKHIQKMKLDAEERIKRYEIECKYNK